MRPLHSRRIGALAAIGALSVAGGCEQAEQVVDRFRDLSPHETYAEALRLAGFGETALGHEWLDAAEEALIAPVPVELPHRESGFIASDDPHATAYRLSLRRGQVLTVRVEFDPDPAGSLASGGRSASSPVATPSEGLGASASARPALAVPDAIGPATGPVRELRVHPDSLRSRARASLRGRDSSTRLFVDLFRVPTDVEEGFRPVESASGDAVRFEYEPWRGGEYILRVQPELLRGGRYRVTLSLDPALAFPVEGRGLSAIHSVFGDPRDGGRRAHHGVDIFAPRGTPVLAVAEGRVSRANQTARGGRVVWIRRDGERRQSLYYAHLDSQAVRSGQRVQRGDTVGFVGNSGNARTTPPHLHFGVYSRGPVDPIDYLRVPARTLPALPEREELLGAWIRTHTDAELWSGPAREVLGGGMRVPIAPGTPMEVLGGTNEWWRVRLPDGRRGYVSSASTESLEEPVARRVAEGDGGHVLRAAPSEGAPVMTELPTGGSVVTLGWFGGFELVEGPGGRRGWIHSTVVDG